MDHRYELGWFGADVEGSLRRIAVAYRVVAVIWSGVLVVSAFLTDTEIPRPAALLAGYAVLVGWGVFVVLSHFRRPAILGRPAVVVVDVAIAVLAMYVPWMAGNTTSLEFSGGYPLSSVALTIATIGSRAGLVVGAVLLGATLIRRFVVFGDPSLGNVVSEVMAWVFPTILLAWAAMVIRGFDQQRRRSEEALADARATQARLEERAEVAAHLHDSVLQTLALIQREPDDTEAVASLARRQERELRSWLYGGDVAGPDVSLKAAVERMCAEVEDTHRVVVEVATAGDMQMTDDLRAAVGAAREALINSAKHAGEQSVSVFAEVDGAVARIFVRDRGVGYDPQMIPEDRRGVRDSIVDRMHRHGGVAEIRTAPGKGTEVRLEMPVGT